MLVTRSKVPGACWSTWPTSSSSVLARTHPAGTRSPGCPYSDGLGSSSTRARVAVAVLVMPSPCARSLTGR